MEEVTIYGFCFAGKLLTIFSSDNSEDHDADEHGRKEHPQPPCSSCEGSHSFD